MVENEANCLRSEKINEIFTSMDFKSERSFDKAWLWVESNLKWINKILYKQKLEMRGKEFTLLEIKKDNEVSDQLNLSFDGWIDSSKRLSSLLEQRSLLFGQLACITSEWHLEHFLENDVKYLINYLKNYNLLSHFASENPISGTRRFIIEIIDVYDLCKFFGNLMNRQKGYTVFVDENFILPMSLFISLLNEAGFPEGTFLLEVQNTEFEAGFYKLFADKQSHGFRIEEGAMMVFSDSDIDNAIESLINNYIHGPKSPWLIKKVLVQESVSNGFVISLCKRIDNIKISSPSDLHKNSKLMKTLISEAESIGIDVLNCVTDNGSKGPIIFLGLPPSCLDLHENKLCLPFITVQPFRTTEECICLANNSIACNNASIWTESQTLAVKVHNLLQMKTVWLNAHGLSDPLVPFHLQIRTGLRQIVSINHDIYRLPIKTSINESSYSLQEDGKSVVLMVQQAQKKWWNSDLLERSKVLKDIALSLRKQYRVVGYRYSDASDVFFYYTKECQNSTFSSAISTLSSRVQVSCEPHGIVFAGVLDSNDFLSLALLTAPFLCYGNAIIVNFCTDESKQQLLQFKRVLVESGLDSNLFVVMNLDPFVCDFPKFDFYYLISTHTKDLLKSENNRYLRSFDYLMKCFSYEAFLPKILWL